MADTKTRTTRHRVHAEVNVPRVPNFLLTDSYSFPLSAFTDDDLRAIGQVWIDNLVKRAQEQREDSKHQPKEVSRG